MDKTQEISRAGEEMTEDNIINTNTPIVSTIIFNVMNNITTSNFIINVITTLDIATMFHIMHNIIIDIKAEHICADIITD